MHSTQILSPLAVYYVCVCNLTNIPLPLPSISMAAERTCRSIWLIIFTLPAEAGLSWGYLHLSQLPVFVQLNNGSYYPTNHLFFRSPRMYPSGAAHTVPYGARQTRASGTASRVTGRPSEREDDSFHYNVQQPED